MGLPLLLLAAGTGVAAYGAYQQGQAAKTEAKNAETIANYKADVAEKEGIANRQAKQAEADRMRRIAAAEEASDRTIFNASGITGGGSVLTVLSNKAKNYELDILNTMREGDIAYQRGLNQKASYGLEAKSYASQAKYAGRGGILSATGTVLAGASKSGIFG